MWAPFRKNAMRCSHYFAIFLVGFAPGLAVSQVKSPNIDFSTLTVSEAKELMKNGFSGEERQEFVGRVFESKRLDLVEVAWLGLVIRMDDDIANLPDSSFKEDVLLLMLRTDSLNWPDAITFGLRGILENTEPFTGLIKKYLPGVEPTVQLIATRQARLRLVAQIEHAR